MRLAGWCLLAFVLLALNLPASLIHAQDALSTPDIQTPDAQVKSGDTLRLRAAPSTTSTILTVLQSATPLTILGVSADRKWLQVQTSGDVTGWVFADYVDVSIDLDSAFPVGSNDLRLTPDVVAHIRQIYAQGRANGNQANVFAKVGDSITVSTLWLDPIGDGLYNLGAYTDLQPVIDFYASGATRDGHNAFNDRPLAAEVGWTSYMVLDPQASDPSICHQGESPLLCEYRVLKPSVALIMFGTNDVGVLDADHYRANLDQIVQLSEAQGIIPILSTFPVRVGHEDVSHQFNALVADVATRSAIPLLDYSAAMLPLGVHGFDADGVHPSVPPKGYEGAADFRSANLHYGYVIRNLTALQMLDAVWRTVAPPVS